MSDDLEQVALAVKDLQGVSDVASLYLHGEFSPFNRAG